jgi:hypothetical protein
MFVGELTTEQGRRQGSPQRTCTAACAPLKTSICFECAFCLGRGCLHYFSWLGQNPFVHGRNDLKHALRQVLDQGDELFALVKVAVVQRRLDTAQDLDLCGAVHQRPVRCSAMSDTACANGRCSVCSTDGCCANDPACPDQWWLRSFCSKRPPTPCSALGGTTT